MVSQKRIQGMVERHLGPDASDDMFAKAMTYICEGYSPSCSDAQTCLHDGDCFRKSPHLQAARLIERQAEKESGVVQAYLRKAAQSIRSGEIYIGAEIRQF